MGPSCFNARVKKKNGRKNKQTGSSQRNVFVVVVVVIVVVVNYYLFNGYDRRPHSVGRVLEEQAEREGLERQ